MSSHTATPDFAFDYTRGARVAKPAKAGQKKWFTAWFERFAEARTRTAMAQIAMIDPRLARELQIARDRSEWADQAADKA